MGKFYQKGNYTFSYAFILFSSGLDQQSKIPMDLGTGNESEPHKRYYYTLVYEVFEDINTKSHSCNASESYSKDRCFLEKLHAESIKQIGCTTPYGLDKSRICTDVEKAKKALDLYKVMQRNVSEYCVNPCKYVVPQLFYTHERPSKREFSRLDLWNNGAIKVTKSKLDYDVLALLADIGGYVGLFLGIALVHIKEVFRALAQKLKSE